MKRRILISIFMLVIMLIIPLVISMPQQSRMTFFEKNNENVDEEIKEEENEKVQDEDYNENDKFLLLDKSNDEVIRVSGRDFMRGAIATEMPITFEIEALKAQAVAAFTYYTKAKIDERLKKREELKGADFEVNTKEWLYWVPKKEMQKKWAESFEKYYRKLEEVVDSVFNVIIENEGKPIVATYHAISSGKTEKSSDIFGGDSLSYLKSVPSPGDILDPNYQTKKEISVEEVRSKLEEKFQDISFPKNKEDWFQIVDKTPSGTAKKIQIGNAECSGKEIRALFSLRSSNFDIESSNGRFIFIVRGYGHGVGMSQVGAQSMAKQGLDYEQILAWYYPGTVIKRK
ncbi:MAG: stage II sporulation protein D [Oscillospiraceae bacterium]|nr:stage II sporulation protein D [Oscillospiraceae bacterium]